MIEWQSSLGKFSRHIRHFPVLRLEYIFTLLFTILAHFQNSSDPFYFQKKSVSFVGIVLLNLNDMGSDVLLRITLSCCIFVLVLPGQNNGNRLTANGTNVCSKRVSFSENYKQSYRVPHRYEITYKCGLWDLKICTRNRTIYLTNYRTITRKSYRKQYQCCKGWRQVGDQCTKAICTQPCVNGTCSKPDYCSCYSGYYGKLCEIDCPSHKWGPHCRHYCLCQNNAKCSPHTGICMCTPGWKGQYCNKTCDQGYYGDKCQHQCMCLNGATCEPVSGNCSCAAGYQGQRCERLCMDDIMGCKCQGNCACHNNATCSPHGFCNCIPGYTGMLCEKRCSAVLSRCIRQCNCSQWGYCNPYSGLCSCQPGYVGEDCSKLCPDGQYGPGCTAPCKCQNNATCSKVDGSCDCLPGWTGVECNTPCPAGNYGKNCQSKCLCQNDASCDPVTGQCKCVGEWQGRFCNASTTFHRGKQSKYKDEFLLPGVLCGVGFIIIITIVVVVLIKCRKQKKSDRIKMTKDPPVTEKDKKKVESSIKNGGKRKRKRQAKKKENSNLDINLEAPFYVNFQAQNSKESHVVSVSTVTIETHYTDLRYADSLGNQDVYQSLDRNLKDSQLNGMGIYGNQEHCHGYPKGFHGDYQSLRIEQGDNHVYQGLSFKDHSTGEVESPALYDNVSRVLEISEPQYEISPLEEDETYITMISLSKLGTEWSECLLEDCKVSVNIILVGECPSHKWGPRCRHDCLCQNNAKCSPHTGVCKCTPGWKGQYCNKTCDHECTCLNGATCDPVSGKCTCAAGCVLDDVNARKELLMNTCEKLCMDDIMGRKCQGNCACYNNATCSPHGFCNCIPGYTGMLCEKRCSAVLNRCIRQCNCSQWGHCNPYSGLCSCQPGYVGEDCGKQCPRGLYGPGCTAICKCQNNATCSKVDGSCDCLPGWTGVECNTPCPAGNYGKNCQSKCLCQNDASCDPVTGQCTTFHRGKQNNYIYEFLLPGVLCGVGFIIIITIVVVVLIKCRKQKKSGRMKMTKDPPVTEKDKTKVDRKRQSKGKVNSNLDIKLQAPFYDNFQAQNSKESHVVSVSTVTIETHHTDLRNAGRLGNQDFHQSLDRNLKDSQLTGIGIYGNQEHCHGIPKGFHGDYQSLIIEQRDNHVYQGLSSKGHSTGEVESPAPCDNVFRVPEISEPQYEISPLEEDETYITMITRLHAVIMIPGFVKVFAFSSFVIELSLLAQSLANLAPNGANVCSKTVSFSQTYAQSHQVSYRHKSNYKCGIFNWGRCTRYRTAYRAAYRTATRTSYRKQYQCCKGWSQVRDQCTKAICTQPCVNGRCSKPDYCSCNSGYYGKLCERDCPSHKWGPHCRHYCLCQNNAKCSPHTGMCTCTPGWEGQYCNKTCGHGYYGDKCQHECMCLNGATCDPVNGNCTCAAGYQGQHCESGCSRGWYGQDCAVKCACLNGASCDHVNGTCNCTAGWTGDICNQKCPEGTYGYRCAQTCLNCMHGAMCDHVTGVCDCRLGYRGKRCEDLCEEGTYGHNCHDKCACQNNATCSPIDGFCNCTSGYKGKFCEKQCAGGAGGLGCKVHCNCTKWGTCNPFTGECACQPGYIGENCGKQCPDGKYGPGCNASCKCQNNATCSKMDGSCDCLPGWTGVECNNPCPAGYFGKNCQSKCLCQNGASCDSVTGRCICVGEWQGELCDIKCGRWTFGVGCKNQCNCNRTLTDRCHALSGLCLCKEGFAGDICFTRIVCAIGRYGNLCQKKCSCNNNLCDVITGVCICPIGYSRPKCLACPQGTYGYECQSTCQCANGATCDRVTGVCSCTAGWYGALCKQGCPKGTFGLNCNSMCTCQHQSSCDHVTGACLCSPGWTGNQCEKACKQGFYGEDCVSACQCYRENTVSCDHVNGTCYCKPGWTGRECTLFCPQGTYGNNCTSKCSCRSTNTLECNHMTGACTCNDGYTGERCEKECPVGTFGFNCREKCQCKNEIMLSVCDHVTGTCYCKPGLQGAYCNETCPVGTYGQGCSQSCKCMNNATCDVVDGNCTCLPGFGGKYCEELLPTDPTANKDQFGEQDSFVHPGVIIGFIVGLIIILSIIVAIGYWVYRKRQHEPMHRQPTEPIYEFPDAASSIELQTTTKKKRDNNNAMENNYMGIDNRGGVGDEHAYQSLHKKSNYHGNDSSNSESVSASVYQSLKVDGNDNDRKLDPTYQSLTKTGQQQHLEPNDAKNKTVAMATHYMGLGDRANDLYQPLNRKYGGTDENKLKDDLKPQSRDKGCQGDDHSNHDDYQPLKKIGKDNEYQSLNSEKRLPLENGEFFENAPQHIKQAASHHDDGLNNSIDTHYEPVREQTNQDEAVDTPSYEILPPRTIIKAIFDKNQ
ncbi:uncharacterized protein LOC116297674 [Actinia tenebrosa]|uniref:Uncharacterized protein LOC116297674 n=1 Tax=Actinia tenebrosa TaxID=6105 RepID=A0A6P8I9J2_ACTTE|nr:uncharacterized protein LOC116297674 [Actinia tenebrosa]